MTESVSDPAAGQGSKDDRKTQQRKNDTDQGVFQPSFLTKINGDKGINDGIGKLIETPRPRQGDTFVLPQITEKSDCSIHKKDSQKDKIILHNILFGRRKINFFISFSDLLPQPDVGKFRVIYKNFSLGLAIPIQEGYIKKTRNAHP